MKISESFKPVTHTIRLTHFIIYIFFWALGKKFAFVWLLATGSDIKRMFTHTLYQSTNCGQLPESHSRKQTALKNARDRSSLMIRMVHEWWFLFCFKAPLNLSLQRLTPKPIGQRLIALSEEGHHCKGKQPKANYMLDFRICDVLTEGYYIHACYDFIPYKRNKIDVNP